MNIFVTLFKTSILFTIINFIVQTMITPHLILLIFQQLVVVM